MTPSIITGDKNDAPNNHPKAGAGKPLKLLAKTAAVLLALSLWQLGAQRLGHAILLVTPVTAAQNLMNMIAEPGFWQIIRYSFARILAGFFGGLLVGALLAVAASRFFILNILLWPYITAVKSTPVASFIILCLIFLNVGSLSIFVSFLIVMPIVYNNLLEGIRATEQTLLEMARIFRVNGWKRVLYIYMPQVKSYVLAACGVSIGMAWKSGIAAEVIGIPKGSIGERLY
jgi:NitT/TauT family transport system permease protein